MSRGGGTRRRVRGVLVAAGVAALMAASAGCSNSDPFGNSPAGASTMIVIGSQDYYSNEIIAEIFAQELESAGYSVDRQFRIGQREAYLPEIEAGRIDLFPEYTGPLLQYWEPDTTARKADDVYAQLVAAAPAGLRVLAQAPATDQDTYAVTQAFADRWHLSTIADLAGVSTPMTLGANSEAQERPNGPAGLAKAYGVQVGFTPIDDGGGPLTIKALIDGDIQLAILYTADPAIAKNHLVTLQDTEGLFLASHVVPVASANVDEQAETIIDSVTARLTTDQLVALNARSIDEQLPAATIAKDWLAANAPTSTPTPAPAPG